MATNKIIDPTNVTVQIPAMADKPNQAANTNCIDKIIDAVNALNSKTTEDITLPSGLFSSSNSHSVTKRANVCMANFDVTVGNSNIPAWTVIGTSPYDGTKETTITIHNSTGNAFVPCPYAAWSSSGISLPIALSANTRYIIRVIGL